MKNRRYIWLMAGAMLMAGCHVSRKAAEPAPAAPVPAEEPTAPTQEPRRTYTVMNFTGEAEGITVAGQLRVAEDSAMWVSLTKIIEVGRAMATRDSLFLRAPMLGYDVATDYAALSRRLKRKVTYDDLQAIALSDNAEEQIGRLSEQMGFKVAVHFIRRRQVESLTFPFPKNPMP